MTQISNPSTILMTAILSMDTYNRDGTYAPLAMKGRMPTVKGSQLGAWTLGTADFNPSTAFGAIAWTSNNQTIIAYEGTIAQSLGSLYRSAVNGYGIFFGSPTGPIATAALDFYNQALNDGQNSGNIILTGHSLGGGVAGFVGALEGKQGILFDNMSYSGAVENAYKLAAGYAMYDRTSHTTIQTSNPQLATKIYSYSNVGHGYLRRLIERVTDAPFVTALRSLLLAPLGLTAGVVGTRDEMAMCAIPTDRS